MADEILESLMQALLDSTFPDASEKSNFLKWSTDLDVAMVEATEESLPKRSLDPEQYQRILMSVDWSSVGSIEGCQSALYELTHTVPAKPICLGQDHRISYYFQPQMVWTNSGQDLSEDADVHPSILEMRPTTGWKVPFKYGFCLGTLEYSYTVFAYEDPHRLFTTPFHIYLDVQSISKDIWIVLATVYFDELMEEVEVDPQSNVWDLLPSPQDGRAVFRAMKITSLDRFSKSDEQQPFFDQRIGGQGFDLLLRPWVVEKDTVVKALKRRRSSSNLAY